MAGFWDRVGIQQAELWGGAYQMPSQSVLCSGPVESFTAFRMQLLREEEHDIDVKGALESVDGRQRELHLLTAFSPEPGLREGPRGLWSQVAWNWAGCIASLSLGSLILEKRRTNRTW